MEKLVENLAKIRDKKLRELADKVNPVPKLGRRDASENTGSVYAIMGDDALRIFGNINKYKGAGILGAAQVMLAASYMTGKKLFPSENTPLKEVNAIKADVAETIKEGSSFDNAFSRSLMRGDKEFKWTDPKTNIEGTYPVILATDDPDVQLVPQRKEKGETQPFKTIYDHTTQLRNEERYITPPKETKQEGGLLMPPEMGGTASEIPMGEPVSDMPVDTYPNATPEEIAAAQEPDEVMEEDYVSFIMDEALEPEEQQYLTNALEADPQLSQIFDKVVETASEFSGAGEVQGPGNGISDSIPARLSDGEFVMTQKATEQLGSDNLQTLMDEAEKAYDGGLMREGRYLGGVFQDDEKELRLLGEKKDTDDDIRKLMSIRANKTPSLR